MAAVHYPILKLNMAIPPPARWKKEGDMFPEERVSLIRNVKKENDEHRALFRYTLEFTWRDRLRDPNPQQIMFDGVRLHIERHNQIFRAHTNGMDYIEKLLVEWPDDPMQTILQSLKSSFRIKE